MIEITRRARAFTRVEAVVTVVTLSTLGFVSLAFLLPALGGTRCGARDLKDAAQVRAIQQAIITWAGNNRENYPLPSLVDLNGTTVPEAGAAKDTSANLFSLLVYGGLVSPELCVSPAEANPNIQADSDYQYQSPRAATDPAHALWDPAFSADFTNGRTGNLSYAHVQPAGGRRAAILSTSASPGQMAMLANRGPQVRSVKCSDDGGVTIEAAHPESLTTLMYGRGKEWKGNIAFGDGHVDIKAMGFPRWKAKPGDLPTYTNAAGGVRPDAWFYDEPDDPASANDFLGIFTTAGDSPSEFRSIWD